MDGISVCLVDDFGEPIDAHLIASVGRRKRRRALGNAKLAGDLLVGLFGSDATNPYSFRIIQWNQLLGRSARSEYVQQTDSSWARRLFNDVFNSGNAQENRFRIRACWIHVDSFTLHGVFQRESNQLRASSSCFHSEDFSGLAPASIRSLARRRPVIVPGQRAKGCALVTCVCGTKRRATRVPLYDAGGNTGKPGSFDYFMVLQRQD
jgi:hypothetical protein